MTQEHAASDVPTPKCPFDPFSEDYLSNPYKVLKELRENTPVFYDERLDYWVVTKYEDVRECFRNQDKFSAAVTLSQLKPLSENALEKLLGGGVIPNLSLVDEDPPIHAVHKRRLMNTFSPQKIRALEPAIRRYVKSYVDAFIARGQADLVKDLTWEVPALVLFNVNGVPDEELDDCKRFATSLALFNWGFPTEEQQLKLVESITEYWKFIKRHVERMKANPGDDMVSDLLRANREDPENFSEDYIVWLMLNFTYAGHETTTSASANMFRALLENRDEWEKVCADPTLIPKAVEECLRYSSSVIAWRRLAKEDVVIDGQTIPKGSKLLIVSGAANFDADVFDGAEDLDIHRENAARHLSFGFGAHLCMGAPLARLEMQVMLEELTRRLPHMRLVDGQRYTFSANTSFRGPEHVMVEWDPRQNPVAEDRVS